MDAALDAAGSVGALRVSVELAADKNRIGTTAFNPVADELGIRRLGTKRSTTKLEGLTDLYTANKLRIVIQETYPVIEAAEAHRVMETGHVRGKLVLTV